MNAVNVKDANNAKTLRGGADKGNPGQIINYI